MERVSLVGRRVLLLSFLVVGITMANVFQALLQTQLGLIVTYDSTPLDIASLTTATIPTTTSHIGYIRTDDCAQHQRGQIINQGPCRPKNFQALSDELESSVTERYFVYDDSNLTLPELRSQALGGAKLTWPWSTNKRFASYGQGEIRFLQALEEHPLRTRKASEASFFVIPIPFGATWFWGTKRRCPKCMGRIDREQALRYLVEHTEFLQRGPERHVLVSVTEHMFTRMWGVKKD
jgi:hypothetical protein